MNGDEKEEAHRPRPLSAGIWTLFSWLRRSDRSSSSESVSSVGSARTAVSFDFLAPGNYNLTNKPIVLTTPLNPPTESYKRRLQDRNLRRQRDRDVTLHRKYGLFREHGNGYDGFTLPPARRLLGNTVDRPNRERRAASECLQRRAAYVPGKRRAPLPPALATSASLPRTYKRKRPAPKPPIKNTYKDNNNIVQLINNSVRMTSNSEPEAKFIPNNESLNSSKNHKCDKKDNKSSKDKSKADKNFLKHIFENRKRSSVIETTSVRLLPSISELDKQATEIIENNKLRQTINNLNPDDFNNLKDTTALYEGNSWFCTSCLRKYNSSVDSCNYCLLTKRHSLKNDVTSPGTSIYTQTNINVEIATSSRSSVDERKMLKEILKEMKDSLPKKNKDNKANKVLTEIPTLRIGSTVQETYKDFTSQPSSSSEILHNKNGILSISSLLSETQTSYDKKKTADQQVLPGAKFSDLKKVNQYKVTSAFENKSNIQNSSARISLCSQEHSSAKDEQREKNKNANHSPILLHNKNKKTYSEEMNIKKITKDINLGNTDFKDSVNIKHTSYSQSQLSNKTNDNKEINKSNLQVSHEKSSNILLGHRQHFLKDQIHKDNINNGQDQVSSTSATINISTESDKALPKPSKVQFLNFPNVFPVVVNKVTVITAHSNNNSSETSKKLTAKNTEQNSIQTGMSKVLNETKITNVQFQSPLQTSCSSAKNVKTTNNQNFLETKATEFLETPINNVKPEYDLQKPLNISSLLNSLQTPNNTTVEESKSKETDTHKHFQKDLSSNSKAIRTIDSDNGDLKVNKDIREKVTPQLAITTSSDLKTTYVGNGLTEPQIKETIKIETRSKNDAIKDVLSYQKALPSTSGCSSSLINSNNNVDKLGHYDRRRHLITQLEQSIAKGDEVAAAEAAVKLAKLRLSCSVLSFSSQIVGENSSAKQNDINVQHNIIETNTTASKDKSLEQSIPQTLTTGTVELVDIKTQTTKSEPVALLEKKVFEKDPPELHTESKIQPHLFTGDQPSSSQAISEDIVPINVWIEDKQAARGPIRLNISRRATLADLRRQAELSLGLATQLQRWIVGRTLCSDDASPIISLAGPYFRAPFYLCIVQPDQKNIPITNEAINDNKNNSATDQNGEFYTELMKLEKQSLVPNLEPFECGVCMEECAAGAGVILRECIHTFCRECLSDVVQHSQEPAVACPATGCSGFLQEREIRTIVTSEEYERWLARGLATAECGTRNAFHCRTRDCTGWAFCDPGVRRFPCPVCKNTNCVQCQAIHEGETCEQYQTKLRQAVTAAENNKDNEGTQALLNSLMARGEALECPECTAIITKKWGCDWVKCSACKTEICWVTKGRRWGPGGRGDTSGGCRCGVDGQRCHPSCGYCH